MAKVEIRIAGVRKRTSEIQDTISRLKLDPNVVRFDDFGEGCLRNKLHIWQGAIPFDHDTTHVCVLDDDAEVVDGFMEIIEKCASRFSRGVFSFFSDKIKEHKYNEITPYVLMRNCNIKGIAIMAPIDIIPLYIDFTESLVQKYGYRHDDGAWRIFSIMNDIPTFCTVPNLVREKDIPSTFAGHGKTNSVSWQGTRIDAKKFDTNKYIVSDSIGINSHLPKGSVEDVLVKNIIANRKTKWDNERIYTWI